MSMISPGKKNRMACVVCGCTQERGCPGGCGWASLKELVLLNCDGPLCTLCAETVFQLRIYAEDVHRFRLAPLMRAVKAAGDVERFRFVSQTLRKARAS